MRNSFLAAWFLRIGLAFVFLYAAIAAFIEPSVWLGYLPAFVANSSSGLFLLHTFSVIELPLAGWLLSGKKTWWAASVAALMFAGIIVANFASMDIIFRDIGLLLAAIALGVLVYPY